VIGAVELGADFGPIFLDYINRTFPGKWGIYNLKEEYAQLTIHT
jgi:hypothetical protein